MKVTLLNWAFQYVDDKYLDIVEQERVVRTAGKGWNRWGTIAACIIGLILLLGLPTVAIAANWFGLRDMLLPPAREKSHEPEDGSTEQAISDKEEGDISEAGAQSVISLSGYQGSPEWQALAEWQAFLDGYDRKGNIPEAADERLDASFIRYSCYKVYSQEAAQQMEEIAAKYGLTLHTVSYDLQECPELLESCGNFLGEEHGFGYTHYMYEDGTFETEGTMDLPDSGAWDFVLLRSVRGSFHDAMLVIGNVGEYEEWYYETACGVTVTLALGPKKALIVADLKDCFVTASVSGAADAGYAVADAGFTRTDLEALADGIDFAALSPVVAPGNARTDGAAAETDPDPSVRKIYAAVLRNTLYSNILPDGTVSEIGIGSASQFAVGDVDSDGREELVLLCDPGVMAGMRGYIIGCDGDSGEIFIQLEEFPAFEFLQNGSLRALDSHNQTCGELWPYYLYRYLPESDSYECVGHVYAEDQRILEANGRAGQYPGEADKSGTGTVYYISPDGWGTAAPADETDYLAWLAANQGDGEEIELSYLPLTEENIVSIEP